MEIIKSIFYFILAGIFEIGGGYLVWTWLRDGKSFLYGILGAIILILYESLRCSLRAVILVRYMQHMEGYLLFYQSYGDGKLIM